MNIHSSNIQGQIDGEREDKGFTLIEILIAIVLVGILSAVAVVGISNLVSKGGDVGIVQRHGRFRQGGIGRVLRGQRQHLSDQLHRVDHAGSTGAALTLPSGVAINTGIDRLEPGDRGRWHAGALRHQLVPDDDRRERPPPSDVRLHSLT